MSQNQGLNRREFLRLAGFAAIGTGAVTGLAGCGAATAAATTAGGAINFSKETDALIIGTGGAGLWAAYELCKAGIKPVILEKQPSWGGDTILACGVLPITGTVVQKQQGITAATPAEVWEKNKEAFAKRYAVPELMKVVYENGARIVDIWTEEFGVEWMKMDPKAYTNFFHIAAPGMQNDHKLLEPLVKFAKDNGAEFMFETKALNLIVDENNAVVGVRVQDQVTGKFQDIKAKKILLATGDWVSNQEMVAKHLPKWEGLPMTTYTSMGNGVEMGAAIGAGLVRMEEASNLMSHFAPTVVWGYYDSLIHVSPEGKRLGNENNIHAAADHAKEAGFLSWWTIADDGLVNGVHADTFRTREKAGGVVKADTVEELAAKTHIPFEQLKATIDKYNEDAKTGTDTEFKKAVAFTPISAPYYAIPSTVVRYKTNGGLDINVNCEVLDRAKTPIPNLYAAGACQGQTTPNVNDVCAVGMHAGQQMAAALKKA